MRFDPYQNIGFCLLIHLYLSAEEEALPEHETRFLFNYIIVVYHIRSEQIFLRSRIGSVSLNVKHVLYDIDSYEQFLMDFCLNDTTNIALLIFADICCTTCRRLYV
jgi:hypothetical protein